jgi:hypothetical protein
VALAVEKWSQANLDGKKLSIPGGVGRQGWGGSSMTGGGSWIDGVILAARAEVRDGHATKFPAGVTVPGERGVVGCENTQRITVVQKHGNGVAAKEETSKIGGEVYVCHVVTQKGERGIGDEAEGWRKTNLLDMGRTGSISNRAKAGY